MSCGCNNRKVSKGCVDAALIEAKLIQYVKCFCSCATSTTPEEPEVPIGCIPTSVRQDQLLTETIAVTFSTDGGNSYQTNYDFGLNPLYAFLAMGSTGLDSLAFLPTHYINGNGSVFLEGFTGMTGISTNQEIVGFSGELETIDVIDLGNSTTIMGPFTYTEAENTLIIKPTGGEILGINDYYYSLEGSDSEEPITINSCMVLKHQGILEMPS
jgi:hypothetical protein